MTGMKKFFATSLTILWLSTCVYGDMYAPQSRQRRFSTQSCTITPDNSEDKVVDRNTAIKISCSFDDDVESCTWTHYEPQNDARRAYDPDIKCSSSSGDNGRTCDTDSRIMFQMSTSQCGITLSNAKPEDTGRWRLIGLGLTSTGSSQTTEKNFELFTYNQSYVRLTDQSDSEVRTVETTYNWNSKEEEWEPGKGDFETLEFRCQAYGGRPLPEFVWYIDNNNNDVLSNSDGFQVTEGSLPSTDTNGYIKSFESRIQFRVDDKLLEKLQRYSIDTNPSGGSFGFELHCDVIQGTYTVTERPSVRINVKRSYDDGNLKAGTIGIIVGVVVAVVIAIIAIAILVFAKSSGRWCFAEDEEAYRKPHDARPRNAQSAQGPRRS